MNFVQKRLETLFTKKAKLEFLTEHTGGLSKTSKMPGYSYSISAHRCNIGSKLVNVPGSVCHSCYALKGRYLFPNVREKLEQRYMLSKDSCWHLYMVELIRIMDTCGYFRWFDSGDLQSLQMLKQIVYVARELPEIRFWLPTRERKIVREYLSKHGEFPSNLVVRVSDHMIDDPTPLTWHPTVSGVTTNEDDPHLCPAHSQGNQCLDCRRCWDAGVSRVNYLKH